MLGSAFRRLQRVSSFLAAFAFAGCLPVSHTLTTSPAVVGMYQRLDGSPVAGAPLALSSAGSDSTCSRAALHATTDSVGKFSFPETRRRERFILLLPVDRVFEYTLCGGERLSEFLYAAAFLHFAMPEVDSISCTSLGTPSTGNNPSMACTRPSRRRRY